MKNPRFALATATVLLAGPVLAACSDDDDPTGPGEPGPSQVTLSPGQATLESIGEEVEFEAEVQDEEGNEMTATVEWSSTDSDVLEHQGGGTFVSLANGSAEVVAEVEDNGGPSESAEVEVEQVPAEVAVDPASLTLWAVGQESALSAEATDAEGTPLEEDPGLSWDVEGDDPAVEVDGDGAGQGVVTALEDGEAHVTAAADGASGESAVQVEATFVVSACLDTLPDDPEDHEDCDSASMTAHDSED